MPRAALGSNAADGANLTIGAFTIDLFTNVAGFNGSQDIYTPASPISIPAGTALRLTGASSTADFDIESVTLNVPVPEPASLALLSLGTLALLRRRRG